MENLQEHVKLLNRTHETHKQHYGIKSGMYLGFVPISIDFIDMDWNELFSIKDACCGCKKIPDNVGIEYNSELILPTLEYACCGCKKINIHYKMQRLSPAKHETTVIFILHGDVRMVIR